MQRIKAMKNKTLLCAACMVLLALSGGTIIAKIVYVNEDYVELRSDKGGWSDPILTLHKGAAMQVLEGEGDDSTSYYKVSIADANGAATEGYVFKSLVSDQKPSEGAWSQQAGYYGNAEASQEGATAAAKGLGPAAQHYLQGNQVNLNAIVEMDNIHKTITGNEIHEFMKDGAIGVYQHRPRRGGDQ
jgi:hypothetical protein